MSKIGMVILNYNDYETTSKYIDMIKNYKSINNIVIVDNNSTDGSYEKLSSINNNKIKVIKTDKNKGYAYGNNFGINYLNKNNDVDYIIISNPDIIVEEKVIKKLQKDMDNNEDISIVCPVINQLDEKIRGWRLPTIKDEILLNINYIQRKVKKKLTYSEEKYSGHLTKVDVVPGCFFMIRKDIMKLIGNFDEATFLYYEENILGQKLKNIDKKTYVDNEVSVIHDLSVSVDKSFNSIKKYKILKQSQKYFVKNYLNANIFDMMLLGLTYYISLGVSYVICFFKNIRSKK
ncbi:MAG: glycosyltransferase family 2 protein [Bacilli bacterium]|nr:glycosyltransferase family 2 protein [Bacilli bacterium]